jgi:hypothetical protein
MGYSRTVIFAKEDDPVIANAARIWQVLECCGA